jgi:hypothetical protein
MANCAVPVDKSPFYLIICLYVLEFTAISNPWKGNDKAIIEGEKIWV